jgi:cyclopropane fatty-acyl-phospholipid synthase-like methyltransferase
LELNTSAAAERNKQPISTELQHLLPPTGRVLEIASGTGQHVAHFAQLMPDVSWQPSDRGAEDLAQLDCRRRFSGLANILPAVRLDVLEHPWPVSGMFSAVVCINMIHISPWETTPALFAGARRIAPAGTGLVILYGPFREGGSHTAQSNEEFDQWLKAKDPRFGVRNLEDVEAVAQENGFTRVRLAQMPANNLLVGFRRVQTDYLVDSAHGH